MTTPSRFVGYLPHAIASLLACGPSVTIEVEDQTHSDRTTSTGDPTVDTAGTEQEPSSACDLEDDDDVTFAAERVLRVVNRTGATIFLDRIGCSRRSVLLRTEDGHFPGCGTDCAAYEASPTAPEQVTCGHCANVVVKLDPGRAYEETWSGWLYEDLELPEACPTSAFSTSTCLRHVLPEAPITAAVVASYAVSCGGDPPCDCDTGDQGWCTITDDPFGAREVDGTVVFQPSDANVVEIELFEIDR